nr:hypothetical protein [Tanacetum cinerariifolium]
MEIVGSVESMVEWREEWGEEPGIVGGKKGWGGTLTPPKWLATEYESGACYSDDQQHKIYIERLFKSGKTDTLDFQQHYYKKPEA